MTRVCNNCGWVHPPTYTSNTCFRCREPLAVFVCSQCGEWLPPTAFAKAEFFRCKRCEAKRHKRPKVKKDRYLDRFTEKLNSLEAEILTEKEWFDICRYFKGCANCKSSTIDVKQFFVPYELGGPYNKYNMIPLCSSCNNISRIKNPFRKYSKKLQKRMEEIVDEGVSIQGIHSEPSEAE